MPRLALRLFGTFKATIDDQPITGFDSDKVRALFTYLAVESNREHRRQSLVGLFWPEFSERSARTNLRRALSNLRQVIGDVDALHPALIVTRQTIQYNQERSCEVDVQQFRSLITQNQRSDLASLQEACRLYKGDFLEGFSLTDCSSFENWLLVTRESLREQFVDVLFQLAEALRETGEYKRVVELAQEQIRLDSYREEAHRQLMLALVDLGQRNRALLHYQELRQRLDQDLGVGPSKETRQLFEAIRSKRQESPYSEPLSESLSESQYDAPKHNIPAQVSHFVGRERELAEIIELIQHNRLVTLVGAPGTGKTRLALEAVSRLIESFTDGVYFVNLAPISDPLLVIDSIAQVLEIREQSGQVYIDTLKQRLRRKKLLLLLDNFEQLLDSAMVVNELLEACAYISILVTSRESLQLYGEYEYVLKPLRTPDLDERLSLKDLSQYEATELFIKRATAVNRNIMDNEGNAALIADICVRLDGLPLAIELAAAQCKMMPIEMIRSRLEDRFDILVGGTRGQPARLRTLRAAIDWSYSLLDDAERRLFSQLSVFQGGRDIEAVEAVCGSIVEIDIKEGLESLLNKSLLQQIWGEHNEIRFAMLETIHEYARFRLEEFGEGYDVRKRHADFFVSLVEKAEPELYKNELAYWFSRLRIEYDNIRKVLSWSLSEGDPEVGLRMVGALRDFWLGEGYISEGMRWAERILAITAGCPPASRAKAFNTAGLLVSTKGDRNRGEELHLEALAISQEAGDRLNEAWSLLLLARNTTSWKDRYSEGTAYCEKALQLFEDLDNMAGKMEAFNMMGEIARIAGQYDKAKEAYEMCLHEGRESDHRLRYNNTSGNLHYIFQHEGNYVRAEKILLDNFPLLIDLGLKYHIASLLGMLVGPLIGMGEPERAARILGASENLRTRTGGGLPPADQYALDNYIEILKEQLDEEHLEALKEEGERMTLDEVIAYAYRREQESASPSR